MYFHFTILRVMPENVDKVTRILGNVPTRGFYASIKGIDTELLLESLDEPGKLYSFSIWDSPASAQATFANPDYAVLIGDLRSLLLAAPAHCGNIQLIGRTFQAQPPTEKSYIHQTHLTVQPENVPRLISNLYSEKMLAISQAVPGLLRTDALESLDEPGRMISLSWWESPTAAQKAYQMPEYEDLLSEIGTCFIKKPERFGFRVLLIVLYGEASWAQI